MVSAEVRVGAESSYQGAESDAPWPEHLGSGAQTGRYVILARLGEGAMGEVFAGYDRELDRRVCHAMGFPGSIPVSGQTYSRKIDAHVLDVVAGIATSEHSKSSALRISQPRPSGIGSASRTRNPTLMPLSQPPS